MQKIILFAIFILGVQAFAQTITVKDKSNLQALEGVSINNQKTNAKGQVDFANVAVGKNGIYVFT
jgi:hypothetical protein